MNLSLIDNYLKEQQELTAVDKFSKLHGESGLPKQEKFYRDLIPSSKPEQGEQYAFQVDLDTCTGCKACVAGCHNMNGLDESEAWRKVGFSQGEKGNESFSLTITSACHHCLEPGCAQGCPTMAYEKDSETGIVKHLDDQCFGCRYCELKCPYGVPQYNDTLGIVRKCDMCIGRLQEGEAPACVQSCPNSAIKIVKVNGEEVKEKAEQSFDHVPESPNVRYTLPTTQYVSKDENRFYHANAEAEVEAEHTHFPLVFMLVLTQISVGASIATLFSPSFHGVIHIFALFIGAVGLGVAPLHLGKPQLAWRAFLGFRTSWLSREMLTFGPYPVLLGIATLLSLKQFWIAYVPESFVSVLSSSGLQMLIEFGAVAIGLASVFCSTMIYVDTPRLYWNDKKKTFKNFFSTVMSGTCLMILLGGAISDSFLIKGLGAMLIIALSAGKLIKDYQFLTQYHSEKVLKDAQTLLKTTENKTFKMRLLLGLIGGIFAPLFYLFSSNGVIEIVFVTTALLFWIGSEIFERMLFFRLALPQKLVGARS